MKNDVAPLKRIVVTCGDPAGVGPEIFESLLRTEAELAQQCVWIGPSLWCERFKNFPELETVSLSGQCPQAGNPCVKGAALALEAMSVAAVGCKEGRFRSVVTGPISKHWAQKAGMIHPGQTEFFAEAWGGVPTMAFASPQLYVGLVTWHIPLMLVVEHLSFESLARTVRHTAGMMGWLGIAHPRIAVCGLNPHAGEQGSMGREEVELLNPWIDRLQTEFPALSGCHPADTVFHRHREGEFDAVVALYHDQALAPLKTVAFHEAVNVTLGLPFLRTSPDHGTAFDLAGKGGARIESFRAAIQLALKHRA
jgi:4-hydroxythreonine-4-phosphate dehydrogenase